MARAPEPHEPHEHDIVEGMPTCSWCGRNLPKDAEACSECGSYECDRCGSSGWPCPCREGHFPFGHRYACRCQAKVGDVCKCPLTFTIMGGKEFYHRGERRAR